jgi:isopentenyl-diphosphate delta-isomerase
MIGYYEEPNINREEVEDWKWMKIEREIRYGDAALYTVWFKIIFEILSFSLEEHKALCPK